MFFQHFKANIVNTINLLRIKDWVKNILVFFPLIFSGNISNFNFYPSLIITFFAFCTISSLIYIVNDIKDIELDKLHPIKKNSKPLAANKIKVQSAFIIIIVLLLFLFCFLVLSNIILIHIITYFILSSIYIFIVKKIAYIELLFITLGYLIRLDVGSVTININSSLLIIVTTFSVSLFFISLKRLSEMNHHKINKIYARKSLQYYSPQILKFISYSCIIISTILLFLFTISKNLLFFPLLILFIIFSLRYQNFAFNTVNAEFPVNLILNDRKLILISLVTTAYIIFFF